MFSKQKKLALLVTTSFLAIGTAVSISSNNEMSLKADPGYSLTLNSTNKVNGNNVSTTISQNTDNGTYKVDFSYTNVSTSNVGHVVINKDGSIANKDHILSINSITTNYQGNGTLKFRTSYDASTWGGYNELSSGITYSLSSHPYYVEFKAFDSNVDINSIKYTYTCEVNPSAENSGPSSYKLVTNANQISVGSKVVIAAANANYAMSTTQNNNNRGQATINKDNTNKTISWTNNNVAIFELKAGTKANTYAFYDSINNGYLYAASGSGNYLRIQSSIDDNASFLFTISSTSFTAIAQGKNSKNNIKYNSSSGIFSCYSNGQNPISLYVSNNQTITPIDVVGFTANDGTATYKVGDIFDNANTLSVNEKYSDGSTKPINKGEYTYSLRNPSNNIVDSSKPFTQTGNYKLTVNYKNYLPVVINITVEDNAPKVVSLEVILINDEYVVSDVLELEDNILVSLNYSDGSSIDLEYDELSLNGISYELSNPNGVVHDISKEFGIAGNWTLKVYLSSNSNIFDEAYITVIDPDAVNKEWTLVTDASDLVIGDNYVIASNAYGVTAGNFGGNAYMESVTSTFSNDKTKITSLGEQTAVLTLGGSTNRWTLANNEGKLLGFLTTKSMSWDVGTNEFVINISSNKATITSTNSGLGSLFYNASSPRFLNYTSSTLQDVQLYKQENRTPIYPTSISLPSTLSMNVNENKTLSVTYIPANCNQKDISWTSSNTSVATIDNGVVTALQEGTATITVKAKDIDNKELTASCVVNVNPALTYAKTELKKNISNYIENNIYDIDACPTIGTAKLLVIPVWFTDSNKYISSTNREIVRNDIKTAYFGSNEETGWRSVKTFYEEESHGALSLNGTVSEWYECGSSSTSFYSETTGADNTDALVESATNWYFSNHSNESRRDYDRDNNGHLDGVILIYGAPDYNAMNNTSASNLWAFTYWLQNNNSNKTNPTPNVYFWASYDFMYDDDSSLTAYANGDTSHCNIDTHTYIHEMGHVFGINDYYDYSNQTSPAAGFSMQDYNVGGHDPYSCMQYGWVNPYIPTESMTITINDFQSSGDVILLTPNWNSYDSPFDEYFLLELYSPTGLNQLDSTYQYDSTYPKGPNIVGVRLWHVDGRLLYVNSDSNFYASQVTTNPSYNSYYGVEKMLTNTRYTSSTKGHASPLATSTSSVYSKYNELQLIRNNSSLTYTTKNKLSSSDLFIAGSSFSMNAFANQFVNSGKLNQNINLGWSFRVDSINGYKATITVTKQ